VQDPQAPRPLATVESEFRKQDQPLIEGLEAALSRIRARAAGGEQIPAPPPPSPEPEPAASPAEPTAVAAPPTAETETSETVAPWAAETPVAEQPAATPAEPASAWPNAEPEAPPPSAPEELPEPAATTAAGAVEAEVITRPFGATAERTPSAGAQSLPDQVQVIAYPFENFGAVNSFINAIRRIPDVRHVAPRRFRGGIIQLTVEYAGAVPLASHLQVLEGFEPRVVSNEGDTVSVAIGGR